MQHLQTNTTLQGGKYRIERVLGQGGFGITYLARNTIFDVNVTIKEFFMKDENVRNGNSVTTPNTIKSEIFQGQKEKFKKEAKRMFAIKNEHIVGVHDLFEENGTAYYVMDYVDGENLAERLRRTGKPMTETEVNQILPQILDALKSVHDADIWHLDLKPANIMINKSGQVKLIDFGASKQLNAQKGGATTSTAISYTNGYAPREQMEQNYDKFGPWTDIYALGATLYNLLTNKRPPLPTDIDDDISEDKHITLPFPKPVNESMKQRVLWMMNPNRMQRPQNISVLLEENVDEDTIIEVATPKLTELQPSTQKKNITFSRFFTKYGKKWCWIAAFAVIMIAGIMYLLIPENNEVITIESLRCVERDGKYGYVDETGREVVPVKYDKPMLFYEGMAAVVQKGKYGYVDLTGKEIIALKYEYANLFNGGLAKVKLNGKYGYIDKTGNEVVPLKYDYIEYTPSKEGLALVKRNGKFGYIDKTGNEIIPLKYDYAYSFSGELARVRLNGKYGYINIIGKEVTPLKYDKISDLSEGLAVVKKNGKYGYIDKTGKEIIPLRFDEASDFHSGGAAVTLNGKSCYIDRAGNMMEHHPSYPKMWLR